MRREDVAVKSQPEHTCMAKVHLLLLVWGYITGSVHPFSHIELVHGHTRVEVPSERTSSSVGASRRAEGWNTMQTQETSNSVVTTHLQLSPSRVEEHLVKSSLQLVQDSADSLHLCCEASRDTKGRVCVNTGHKLGHNGSRGNDEPLLQIRRKEHAAVSWNASSSAWMKVIGNTNRCTGAFMFYYQIWGTEVGSISSD